MSVNRNFAKLFFLRTRVLWLAASLLLAVSDRSWGQTPTEHSTLVLSIEENSKAGTEVGALAELYPELNSFRLSTRSRTTLFQVHPDTGVISVRDGARLDFEKRPAYKLTIFADFRKEQEDPYLAEFAESLRDEGLSSKALSRLIPLEQRIQVHVQLRDVEEADQVADASRSTDNIEEPLKHDDSGTILSEKPSAPEIVSPRPLPPQSERPLPSNESGLPDPAAQSEMRAEFAQPKSGDHAKTLPGPEAPAVAGVLADVVENDVPMPSDVPAKGRATSSPTGKALSLSESSGQDAFQLNATAADREAEMAAKPAESNITDLTKPNHSGAATAVPTALRRAVLLMSLVSLTILLGTAYLMRHRWKAFRKNQSQQSEQKTPEEHDSEETSSTIATRSSEDPDELKAADEFVNLLPHEDAALQSEEALQVVIAQESDDDHGYPFDPESLIDDEYFDSTDELAALKAGNDELGERLEEKAGLAEPSLLGPMPTGGLKSAKEAIPSTIHGASQTFRFEDNSTSDSGSEFDHDRIVHPVCHRDTVTPAETCWSSDLSGYSEEAPNITTLTATNLGVVVAPEPRSGVAAEATDDKIAGLRTELADLFAIQKKSETAEAKSLPEFDRAVPRSVPDEDALNKSTLCPEESHQESVAQYLSQLLERSKKEEGAEAIFVDRRKPGEKTPGKWDGTDRRSGQKAKAPVKSYIESYLNEHGGELSQTSSTQKSSETSRDELSRPLEQKPVAERRPVDVQAIRQHMNSFRNVSSTALEHALASHQIRQAKGKVAVRTTLVVGLTLVSVLAIATNSAMKIYFPSLGWLMGLIVCLSIAELMLRVEDIRKHRQELRHRTPEPAKKSRERSNNTESDATVATEDACATLS